MTEKQAYSMRDLARKAVLLVDTIRNSTSMLRYLSRTRKEAGLKGYRISIYPESAGRSYGTASSGIRCTVPPDIAVKHLQALARAMKTEAKEQLLDLEP